MKHTLLIAALAAFTLTHVSLAQAATPDDEKKVLAQKVLSLWHIEDKAIEMAQKPAQAAISGARSGLQGRLTAAQQDAVMKDITKDVQKYVDEATPLAKSAAQKVKEPILTPLLLQNFSVEELRQLVTFFESPVKKKFEGLVPDFNKAYLEKVSETGLPAIQPKIDILTKEVGLKMRTAATLAQQQ